MQSLLTIVFFLSVAIIGPALAQTPPGHRPELDRIGHIMCCSWRTAASIISTGCFRERREFNTRGLPPFRSAPKAANSQHFRPLSTT